MPAFQTWEIILGWTIATLSVVLALKLLWEGLARSYPILTVFIAYGAMRSYFVFGVKLTGTTYAYFFMASEFILLLLNVLMVFELYGLIFRSYPSLKTASRVTLGAAVILSIGLAAVSVRPDLAASQKRRAGSNSTEAKDRKEPGGDRKQSAEAGQGVNPGTARVKRQDYRWILDLFMISERGILSALTLMILAMSAVLAYYPIRLPSNVLVHSIVFAAYFLSKAVIILYRNIGGHQVAESWRSGALVVGIVCLAAWISQLKRAGETKETPSQPMWNAEKEAILLQQLKAINAAMGRLARE